MPEKKTTATPSTEDGDPRRVEAKGPETLTVEFKGATYAIPRNYRDWPYLYTFEMEQGHNTLAFRHLLGAEQFERFVATNPTNGDFRDFDVELAKQLGLAQGESEASSV